MKIFSHYYLKILPEDLKTKREFVRVFTYVGLFTMSIDEEFIYFKSFNQTDVKVKYNHIVYLDDVARMVF